MEKDKKKGYFEVKSPKPVAMVGFSLTVSRGPAFKILYSNDGKNFFPAAAVAKSTVNSKVTWSCVGAHTYWRYTLDGQWKGGPWYHNLQWKYLPAKPPKGCSGSVKGFSYSGSKCTAHATHYKSQHGCNVKSGVLHWDSWMEKDKKKGYFEVKSPKPVAMVGFSLTVSRGPAFNILYSDDGKNFKTAASVAKSTVNSKVTWSCVGKHTYWRYQLAGQWKGGPWYHNLQWKYIG